MKTCVRVGGLGSIYGSYLFNFCLFFSFIFTSKCQKSRKNGRCYMQFLRKKIGFGGEPKSHLIICLGSWAFVTPNDSEPKKWGKWSILFERFEQSIPKIPRMHRAFWGFQFNRFFEIPEFWAKIPSLHILPHLPQTCP